MTGAIAVTGAHVEVFSRALPTIGENIRHLRLAAGFKKQGEFADRLKVPQSRVSDWEKDRYGLPDTATLLKIAKGLDCSIDRILDGVDPGYDATKARDLIRQASDQHSGLPQHLGAQTDDTTAAGLELQALRDLVARYEKEAREVRTVTDSLVKVALALEEV